MTAQDARPAGQLGVVLRLGTAQTLAWASSYYLPAMLATAMAADLGVSVTTVFAAFSFALIVSAVFGRWAGQLIDHHGGRPVLIGTNLLFAAGLLALALAQGPALLFLAVGLIQRDGAAVLLGHLANVASIVYFGVLIGGGGMMIQNMLQN